MKYDCLIIDDEKLLADSTAEYFNLFDVKTAVVYSASECRSFFIENTAELLLLDINLEDSSGFELCKELRKKIKIPILFISARYGENKKIQYSDNRLTVDFNTKQVLVEGNIVKLTSLEFKLLSYLIKNENKVISKQELFEQVWEDKFTGDGTLNVHIRKIREVIECNPSKPEYIITVWGDGYKFIGNKI